MIKFTNEGVDADASYDPTTSRFTAKVAGNYLVSATWMSYNRNMPTRFGLFRNGALYGDQQYSSSTIYTRAAATWIVPLTVGQFIEIKGDVSTGSEINIHPDYRTLTIQLVK